MNIANISLAGSLFLVVSGCTSGGIFNYGPEEYAGPTSMSDPVAALDSIRTLSSAMAQRYSARASDSANTSQIFEVPAIAGAVGAVAGSLFRASEREIEALALGAGSVISLDEYYSPRDRAQIYMNASGAMSCVSVLSGQTSSIVKQYLGSALTKSFVRTMTANATTPAQADALQTLAALPTHSVLTINSAINSINTAVLKQSLSKSAMPDFQSLQTKLTTQIQQSITKKAAGAAATTTQKVAAFKEKNNLGDSSPPDPVELQSLTDFAADFDKEASLCTAMMGT